MVACAWDTAFGRPKSASQSMRCEVDLMSVALGLTRFICFCGRRSEVVYRVYGGPRGLSMDGRFWAWERLEERFAGDARWWCVQLLCRGSASVVHGSSGQLSYVLGPSSASSLFLFPKPAV
jgi:hypothetical protein